MKVSFRIILIFFNKKSVFIYIVEYIFYDILKNLTDIVFYIIND